MQIIRFCSNLILITGIVIALAGCGSDDDDDEAPPASRFSGTYVTFVDTGSFTFTVAADQESVSGTINSATLGSISVPGTWDSDFNALRLDSPPGVSPSVQIVGSFDGSILNGFTGGDIGNGGAVAIPDEGNVATIFCGRFTRTSGPPRRTYQPRHCR